MHSTTDLTTVAETIEGVLANGPASHDALVSAIADRLGERLLTDGDLHDYYTYGTDVREMIRYRAGVVLLNAVNTGYVVQDGWTAGEHGDVETFRLVDEPAPVLVEAPPLPPMSDEERGAWRSFFERILTSPEDEAAVSEPDRRSRLVSAAERRHRPEPVWRVEGFLPQWCVGQIYGPSYAGKSFVALDLALRIANGLPDWFGQRIHAAGPVVYALMEGAFDFQQRIEAWLDANPGSTDEALYTLEEEALDLSSETSLAELESDVEALDLAPALIIVDTQALATPGVDENDNTAMNGVFANLKRVAARFRCPVLVVHHTGHDTSRARGASAQFAALDVQLRVTEGGIRLDKLKAGRKWPEYRGFVLEPSGASAYVKPTSIVAAMAHTHASGPLEEASARILAVVRAEPGIKWTPLMTQVGGKRATFDEALLTLLENGVIRESGGAHGARCFYPEYLTATPEGSRS